MTQPRQRFRFAFESVAERFIIGEKRSFERDGAAQTLIDRQINVAHPAFTD
jgi:hypothetical protein